uniref:Pentatricopeptide repeat-containing protein n=1 Tax=Kalanchoe fedtschenkoi TaxID=63787 RepID=A0A7N0TJH6_KALFE
MTKICPSSSSHHCCTSLCRSYSSFFSPSDSLLDRLLNVGDPKLSITPLLEHWRHEGRPVKFFHFRKLVGAMKTVYRWHHALQISQWMSDRRCFRLAPKDVADRLELLARVHGIELAETYFNSMADNMRTYHTYGAMLQSYARQKHIQKAEGIMQKMKELGITKYSFPYNNMIYLYFQIGMYDKVDQLIHEMEMEGVQRNINTVRSLLRAYATSDISKMEKLLDDIRADTELKAGWHEYSVAAEGYIKAGLVGKALDMLKEVEGTIPPYGNRFAAQFLLTHYASLGAKDNVYRVWYQNKPSGKQLNPYAICMMSALVKLDDIDGAEMILKEWESECDQYDFGVVNQLVSAYCAKGLVDKAKSIVVEKLVEGREPCASTWRILAGSYTSQKHMPEAVKMFKKAMLTGKQDWSRKSVSDMEECLDYLEEQVDYDGLHDMVGLLKQSGLLTIDIYNKFLRVSIAARKCVSSALLQMESDGFVVNEETQKILQMSRAMKQVAPYYSQPCFAGTKPHAIPV